MAQPHLATIRWQRTTPGFGLKEYNTRHEWTFDGGVTVPGSSAPALRGDTDCVDPEEAFVAALSSCHMLSFLYCASRAGVTVDSYEDTAEGVLTKAEDRLPWVSKVILHPHVRLADPAQADRLDRLHHEAHEMCFIARSVKTEVVVEPATA